MGNMEKALEELDRKVAAIKTEVAVTHIPYKLIAVIKSASVTLDVGVAVSCQGRTKRRIRDVLYERAMNYSHKKVLL